MKITYKENPLETTVELDDSETQALWYKIKINEMDEMLTSAFFSLEEGKRFDLASARRAVDLSYFCSENDDTKSPLDERCDLLLNLYIDSLKGTHVGDCTCMPCGCVKCFAESLLEIDTTPGLGKHEASKIFNAFGKEGMTIDTLIESLTNFNSSPERFQGQGWEKLGGYEQYLPRWIAEQKNAHDWLVKYKEERLTSKSDSASEPENSQAPEKD